MIGWPLQVTELQCDLLELRDAHAKLRTANEKLRRDKERHDRDRDQNKLLVGSLKRAQQVLHYTPPPTISSIGGNALFLQFYNFLLTYRTL